MVSASQLATLPAGRPVRVAGLVLLRQRPSTAGGMTFVSLEDETGIANLIIRPQIWERYRRVAHTSNAVIASGELQRESGVIHVVVSRLQELEPQLGELRTRSRDFQ